MIGKTFEEFRKNEFERWKRYKEYDDKYERNISMS
jgi:hypothetical protein